MYLYCEFSSELVVLEIEDRRVKESSRCTCLDFDIAVISSIAPSNIITKSFGFLSRSFDNFLINE